MNPALALLGISPMQFIGLVAAVVIVSGLLIVGLLFFLDWRIDVAAKRARSNEGKVTGSMSRSSLCGRPHS
jgi:hypothetical protein